MVFPRVLSWDRCFPLFISILYLKFTLLILLCTLMMLCWLCLGQRQYWREYWTFSLKPIVLRSCFFRQPYWFLNCDKKRLQPLFYVNTYFNELERCSPKMYTPHYYPSSHLISSHHVDQNVLPFMKMYYPDVWSLSEMSYCYAPQPYFF